ncbi:MAG: ABC transporter permease [Cyanobacteria bacterium P01_F01_bin.53]
MASRRSDSDLATQHEAIEGMTDDNLAMRSEAVGTNPGVANVGGPGGEGPDAGVTNLYAPARLRQLRQTSLKPRVFWRLGEDISPRLDWTLRILSVLVPFVLWWLVASAGWVNPKFLPSPVAVLNAFLKLVREGLFWTDLQASIFRVGLGFVIAAIISVPLGIGMGAFASIRALFEPIIGIVRYMPAPAFIPLLIIYLGVDEAPKVTLIFIGVIFFNTLMIMDAVKFVPKHLLEATYTLGGSRLQTLVQVITPYVMPKILDAFRVNMAAAWNLVVVAELIAANEGLGKRIALARRFFDTDTIFAYLIVLGVIGFLIDLSLRWLLQVTCRWSVD